MAKVLPSTQMPSLEEVDMSGLSEWEKTSITTVMAKAQVCLHSNYLFTALTDTMLLQEAW